MGSLRVTYETRRDDDATCDRAGRDMTLAKLLYTVDPDMVAKCPNEDYK